MPAASHENLHRAPMLNAELFAILWCGSLIFGCSARDQVVATVNGVPIHASELEPPAWIESNQPSPDLPAKEMAAWTQENKRHRLQARIDTVLEESAANSLIVTVDAAEIDRMMAAFREFVASTKPGLTVEQFGRQSNARIEALNRLQQFPDKADDIYTELLEPLGMNRSELDVAPETLRGAPYIGHAPETESEWRKTFERQLLRQKRLATLFNVEFEVSDAEVAAYVEKIRSDGDPNVSLEYMALGMVREDRISQARAKWLEKAIAEADVRIVSDDFQGLSLQEGRLQ